MNRKRYSLPGAHLTLVSTMAVLALAGSLWADTTPITFRFNPPDGTTVIQTVKKTKTQYDRGLKHVVTSTVKDKRVFRRTPTGYTMTVTPISSERLSDGIPIDYTKAQPGGNMGVEGTLTYVIDISGKATEVKGVREALSAMANKICAKVTDAELTQKIKDRFTQIEPSATAQVLNEFNDSFAGYSGNTVAVGSPVESQGTTTFPGGDRVVFTSRIAVSEKLTYAGHECVKLQYYRTYDPETLRKAISGMDRGTVAAPPQIASAQLSTLVEKIIDPTTLLCYSQTSQGGLKVTLADGSEGASGYDEKEEITFDYSAADIKPATQPATTDVPSEQLKPGQIRFRFNPPDGAKFLERVKESQYVGRTAGRDLTLAIVTVQGCQVHKNDTGFSVVSAPLSIQTTLNGRTIPPGGLLTERVLARGATLSRKIDDNGRILSVDGLDNFFANLAKLAAMNGSTTAVGILPALRGGVESAVRQEWAERVGNYVGKTMSIGELWKTQEKIPAYSGNLTVSQRTRFVGQEIRDGHTCARLRFFIEADPKVLREEISGAIHDYLEEDGIADLITAPTISNVSFTGTGDRLIDPDTMFLYADSMNYSARFTISVPGHKFTFSSSGKEECSFEYASDEPASEAGPSSGTTMTSGPDTTTIARDMVDCLAKGDYASVIKKFDATMTSALPEDKLRSNWEIVTGSAGQFQAQARVRADAKAGFEIVVVTCRFEKSSIDVQFSFNAKKQISGLFFRPAQS